MNNSLPISAYQQNIVEAVRNHAVTIITAETGSGKSTQVPQYLNEQLGNEVIITEPRRMAAWSLAERVAEEMNTTLGGKVGFRTAFERNYSSETDILYCTDGLELVRLLAEKEEGKEKVLIIDEVHEWNLNIEALIAWSKKKILEGWSTKVVIMSATIEQEKLLKYYGEDAIALNIPGKLFPVSFEERSEDEILTSINELVAEKRNILVFEPGKKEIQEVMESLQEAKVNAEIFPLHGELDFSEQKKCFETYNRPKVIVATNVAQTSITIPDIDAVVDTGLERRLEVENGIQGLFLRNISKADVMQRMGRAGRTKEGKYILCSYNSFAGRSEFSVPEIKRGILDQIVLKLASCNIDATTIEFFHQPAMEALMIAKNNLINLGALTSENEVTEIGHKMAKMPVSAEAARIIIEAEKYGATEEAIVVAAILQMGTLLTKNNMYRRYTVEYTSDLLAEMDVWNELQRKGFINFKEEGINGKTFFRVKEYISKLHEVLKNEIVLSHSSNRNDIRKSCIAGMMNNICIITNYDGWYNSTTYRMLEDNFVGNLDRNSCLNGKRSGLLVGKPRIIEYIGKWDIPEKLNIISTATEVRPEDLVELVPQFIKEEYEDARYSELEDAVVADKTTYYKGIRISETYGVVIPNHPEYETLKKQHEEKQEEIRRKEYEYWQSRIQYVMFDGKSFMLQYDYDGRPYIKLDRDTLRDTKQSEMFLKDGRRLKFCYESYEDYAQSSSIPDLQNMVERNRIERLWQKAKNNLKLKSFSIESVLEAYGDGTVKIGYDNWGEGEPIYGYKCFELQENKAIKVKLLKDKEEAEKKTQDSIEFLYGRVIKEKYSEKKFRFLKKAKGLSPKEEKVKAEFDSEVRELFRGVNIENIEERLEYLEELYQELILDLKVA